MTSSMTGSTTYSSYRPPTLSPFTVRAMLGIQPTDARLEQVDWVSIVVIYWVTLVSEAARGLVLPSAWPYILTFGGSRHTLGILVASFTFGRFLATIPQGYLSDKYSSASVLMAAGLLQACGHLFYALAPNIPLLIASRFIVGFASATVSVCRAHFTRSIVYSKRTHHFAWLSATQFIGFVILPGAGGILANLPKFHFFSLSFMPVNQYTYPAYVLVLCNLLTTFFVFHFYLDPPPLGLINLSTKNTSTADEEENTETDDDESIVSPSQVPKPDYLALVSCLIINVFFRGVVAELETTSVPLLMEIYGLKFDRASYFISLIGVIGLITYLLMKPIARRISDRNRVAIGMLLGGLACIPLGYPPVAKHISLPIFVSMLIIMWAYAYPIGQTALLSLFSELVSGLPVGGFLGIFSAFGALGRALFALFAVLMWNSFGYPAVYASMWAYQSLALVITLCMYRRLVPPSESPYVLSSRTEESTSCAA